MNSCRPEPSDRMPLTILTGGGASTAPVPKIQYGGFITFRPGDRPAGGFCFGIRFVKCAGARSAPSLTTSSRPGSMWISTAGTRASSMMNRTSKAHANPVTTRTPQGSVDLLRGNDRAITDETFNSLTELRLGMGVCFRRPRRRKPLAGSFRAAAKWMVGVRRTIRLARRTSHKLFRGQDLLTLQPQMLADAQRADGSFYAAAKLFRIERLRTMSGPRSGASAPRDLKMFTRRVTLSRDTPMRLASAS